MIQLKQKRKSISIFSDAENPCSLGLVDILEGEVVEAYIEAACKVVVADVLVAAEQFYLRKQAGTRHILQY